MKEDLPGQLEIPGTELRVETPAELRGYVGLITPEELAKALKVSVQTLAGWRSGATGPDYAKLGKGVFYRLVDVQAWIAKNITDVVTGTKAPPEMLV
jgi:helix-turn-helix protein